MPTCCGLFAVAAAAAAAPDMQYVPLPDQLKGLAGW
jgi:hypothetical protein